MAGRHCCPAGLLATWSGPGLTVGIARRWLRWLHGSGGRRPFGGGPCGHVADRAGLGTGAGAWRTSGLWDLESEIDFEPREPVPGRRLYYEELRVEGDRAHVTLRAATDLEIRVRAFGGLWGRELQVLERGRAG